MTAAQLRLAAALAALTVASPALAVAPLAAARAAGPYGPAGWARGDLHQHTHESSDGTWEPEDLWARIREIHPQSPRFVYLSDHCDIAGFFPNPTRPPKKDNWRTWEKTREIRRSLGPDELILTGQEIGGLKGGHIGAIGLPQTRGEDPPHVITRTGADYRGWMTRVRAAGGLNVVYHPRGVAELGPVHPGSFAHWVECMPLIDAVSVWNGYKLYDAPDEWAWNMIWSLWQRGHRVAAVSGSDAHQPAPDGEPLDWWGREGRTSFHCHIMNPHMRVHTGEGPLTEDGLRAALRAGKVTMTDWPKNWIQLEVAAGAASAGPGEDLAASGPVTVTVQGYGDPEAYSGDPVLQVEVGQVGIAARAARVEELGGQAVTILDFDRDTHEFELPRGDFSVTHSLDLGPGEWRVTARVVPRSELGRYWRGVQLTNPVYLKVQ